MGAGHQGREAPVQVEYNKIIFFEEMLHRSGACGGAASMRKNRRGIERVYIIEHEKRILSINLI